MCAYDGVKDLIKCFLADSRFCKYSYEVANNLVVIFLTGVSIKIWNILLQDDGLEENNEVFKIILSKPKNAVLGQKRELTVEILDPRTGKKTLNVHLWKVPH